MGRRGRVLVRSLPPASLDAKPEEVESLARVADAGLLDGQAKPQRGDHLRHFVPQPVRVRLGPDHHDHEVVCVSDDPIGGPAALSVGLPPPGCPVGIPLLAEVLVQHRQCDVGEQRRHDAPCGVPVTPSLTFPSADMTPAVRNDLIRARTRLSAIRRLTRSITAECFSSSKHAAISASNTQ